jgi:hypothetical protein
MCVFIAPWQALRLERNEISLQIWVDSLQNNAVGRHPYIFRLPRVIRVGYPEHTKEITQLVCGVLEIS